MNNTHDKQSGYGYRGQMKRDIVILMATLFPVLRAAGMSTLTAAALIASTATIVPTPLGGDNVVAARVLGFDNVVDYVGVFFSGRSASIKASLSSSFNIPASFLSK